MPKRSRSSLLLSVALIAGICEPSSVAAWKPKTHIYLAEEVMRDALDDGRVTIKDVDPLTGRILGDLGSFEVDPKMLRALRTAPKQFRAGVVGPDAFPDIVTGQTIIHPQVADAIDGQAGGSNAWLTHLWQRGFVASDTPEVNAFTLGYLTHAAGDVFAHTYVNHYAGGEFTMMPDPSNAIKHLVFEGYLGKRTPKTVGAAATSVSTRTGICNKRKADQMGVDQDCSSGTQKVNLPITGADTSIAGLERFIVDEMTVVAPGSLLQAKLYKGEGTDRSIPYIFSTLRNGLAREVAAYDTQRMELRGPARVAFSSANGPQAEFKRAWISDIDKGLAALPAFSQSMSKALVYNEAGADVPAAKLAADTYVGDHLASMMGTPDAAVMTAAAIGAVMERLMPPPLREAMAQLSRAPIDVMVFAATGMTPAQIAGYITYPERHFDEVMTTPRGASGGEVPHAIRLADLNRDTLKIADAAYNDPALTWRIEDLPAAFNTVQLNKMMLLSPAGFAALKAALAAKGATIAVPAVNMMLGWVTSLDKGNQWQGAAGDVYRPTFTQSGEGAYRRLFMTVLGEKPITTVTHGATEPTGGHGASAVDPEAWPPLPAGQAKPTPAEPDLTWVPPPPPGGQASQSAPPGSAPPAGSPVSRTPPASPSTHEPVIGTELGGGLIVINAFWAARADKIERYADGTLHVFMTMRNLREGAYYVSPGSFKPLLLNADGEGISSRGVYRASGDPTEASPMVPGGAEVRVRYIFAPAKAFGRAVRFTLEGDDSRPTNKPVPWPIPADAAEPK